MKMGKGILSKRKSLRKDIILRKARISERAVRLNEDCNARKGIIGIKNWKLRWSQIIDALKWHSKESGNFSVYSGKPLKFSGTGKLMIKFILWEERSDSKCPE